MLMFDFGYFADQLLLFDDYFVCLVGENRTSIRTFVNRRPATSKSRIEVRRQLERAEISN